ncbi:MAG: hypothetical protein KC543_15755 [Myxococcales bacterium]|nr:hypothetical protein [Myxococcales bacterium]
MTKKARAIDEMFDKDEVQDVLRDSFYAPPADPPRRRTRSGQTSKRKRKTTKARPSHYDVICISMYKEDLARLDEKVRALKDSGHRKMSRSALIRFALDQVDLTKLPKSY